MKQVDIIGVGMGPASATAEALALIGRAEVLVGAGRLADDFARPGMRIYKMYRPDEVAAAVEADPGERFAVLVSGDVGFYSGAAGLRETLRPYDVRFTPGVSSVSYFFAKCGLPWQEAALVSCHGADTDLTSFVRRSRLSFALTGGNIPELAEGLCRAGFGSLRVRVGENLGRAGERITETSVGALRGGDYAALSVLLIENGHYDPRIRTGIPDGEFIRSDTPMTKAEVRSFCLSRLALGPSDICLDIGCGTGSVSVEMALSAYRGKVYAIDRNPEALALTEKNCAAFHVGNVLLVSGSAPEAIRPLPPPDAAFIGGSAGSMDGIVAALLDKNPGVRIVATAVALETAAAASAALLRHGLAPEIVQLSAARARAAGGLHMMLGQNPVFVIGGGLS